MYSANALSSFFAALIAFIAMSAANFALSTALTDPSAPATEADMTYFYKAPSAARVAKLITFFDGLNQPDKPGTRPPTMGFLAAAFKAYPADVDTMIPAGLSPTMQGIVATSLRLSGQTAKAQSMIDRLQATGAEVPDLRYVPTSLDAIEANGPNEFDLLWGASFESGDPRYCLKILEHFATVAKVDGNVDDMLNIVHTFGTGADLHWLVQKRGADKARDLITQSTALWALNSNSAQHDFVRSAVAHYIAQHPDEPASKALLTLTQQYGRYDLTKITTVTETAPGKSSATINMTYLGQILDDLARHAGTYPVHFAFPDEQPRAVHDVTAISALLDPLSNNFANNAELQARLALLHSIGFNLDVPDSMDKAIHAYSTVLELTPNDPQANFRYGAFLAATTRKGEGIPYLEKAKRLGAVNADYWLGWSYMTTREKTKAIENLKSYNERVPGDARAAALLDAVLHDKVKFEEVTPKAATH